MIEDQLTKDERIRLEALNQAVASTIVVPGRGTATDAIMRRTERFERWIRSGETT